MAALGKGTARLLLVVAIASVPSAFAQDPDQLYKQGVDALYNLDFDISETAFSKLTRDYPANPNYWTGMASTAWLRILQQQQKLNMESFAGKDTFGTRDSKEDVSAADEAKLRSHVDRAIDAADAILKKNPRDIQALYAKGAANATLASFEGTIKRAYLAAGRKAKTARDLHREVLKIDPEFHDAEMTIGIFNYIVGAAPGWARYTVLLVLGITGDGKETGIRQLESAVMHGKRTVTDAKSLLVVVYTREQRFEDALRLSTELHNKYPRNYMYELTAASLYGRMKRWDSAIETYQRILARIGSRTNGYERLRADKVTFELGTTQIHSYHFEEAVETFKKVVASSGATPNEKASSHLWIGKVYDTSNRRTLALEHYKAIQTLDCDSELKEEARKYERRPFK